MKLLQKAGDPPKNKCMPFLLAAGLIEFLFITLESRCSYIGYYLAETYLVVPCLLFLGYVLCQRQTAFAKRRLLLAVAAVSWFVLSQLQHKVSGMENHPMGTVFFVYLMAFPFASLSDDSSNTGIRWIGKLFVAASLVLVGYSVLLLADWIPAGMQDALYWDGARLHALWHPNVAAGYFMIGIGFTAAFLVQAETTWRKVLLLAAVAVQFLAMALTNCRTTLLLTGALLGGILFFRIFRGSRKQLVLGLLAAAVLLAGSFKLSGTIFRWNNDRLLAGYSASAEVEASEETVSGDAEIQDETGILQGDNPQGTLSNDMRTLNGRTVIWKSALTAIRDNKMLALWGTEYTGTVISVYNPFEVVHAHNSWMEALLRMGILGLLMALTFTMLSVWSTARLLLRKDTELWKKIIAMTAMCVMASGFLEPYLFITNVYYQVMDFLFFFLTGYLDYWCRPQRAD